MSNDGMSVKARTQPLVTSVAKPDVKRADVAAPTGQPQSQPREVEVPAEQLQKVTKQLEAYLRSVSRALEFRVDAASGRTVVTVRDAETGDVIRQIPGDEVLKLAQMADDDTIVLLSEKV